jgi:hypothetical protein
MEMMPVASSLIESVGYDEDAEKLHIKFHSGPAYSYQGVTLELYGNLLQAPSVGKFFLTRIKGKFETEKLI